MTHGWGLNRANHRRETVKSKQSTVHNRQLGKSKTVNSEQPEGVVRRSLLSTHCSTADSFLLVADCSLLTVCCLLLSEAEESARQEGQAH
jgi:hypothetical protein